MYEGFYLTFHNLQRNLHFRKRGVRTVLANPSNDNPMTERLLGSEGGSPTDSARRGFLIRGSYRQGEKCAAEHTPSAPPDFKETPLGIGRVAS